MPQINTRLQPSQITPLPTSTNTQLQLTTRLPTQVNVVEQQQQQQNPQVLQSLAQLQIQNSLPSTQTNVTTPLFEDSDIDDHS